MPLIEEKKRDLHLPGQDVQLLRVEADCVCSLPQSPKHNYSIKVVIVKGATGRNQARNFDDKYLFCFAVILMSPFLRKIEVDGVINRGSGYHGTESSLFSEILEIEEVI